MCPTVVRPPRPARFGPRVLVAVLVLVATFGLVPVPVVLAQSEPPTEPTGVIEGKGWGHGVGMAQDGALALGREGASTAEILQHFYPGTTLGQDGGDVRVAVLDAPGGEAIVSFPGGGEVRSPQDGPQSPGFPVKVAPGGSVRLRFDGAYRAEPLNGASVAALSVGPAAPVVAAEQPGFTVPPREDEAAPDEDDGGLLGGGLLEPEGPPRGGSAPPSQEGPPPAGPPPPGGPPPGPPVAPGPPEELGVSGTALWAVPRGGSTVGVPGRGASYRGSVQALAAGGGLRLVNQVDVEDYLRGMGEVRDSSWPGASLGAQAVAARTYALRAMELGGELCDTQDCQVYLGSQAEYPAMNAAVAATRGQVVQFRGRLAQAVYSASGGGVTATPEEGFGTGGQGLPYLGAVAYPTADPQAWELRVPLAQLGRRLGYPGTLSDVRVAAAGPSGRPLTVELIGDAGSRELAALSFDDTLGLRSTLWSVRVENLPPPPPVEAGDGAGSPGFDAGPGGPRLLLGRRSSSVSPAGQGRLLDTEGLVSATSLAHLEDPLRIAALLGAAGLLVAIGGGATFRLAAGVAPAPSRGRAAKDGRKKTKRSRPRGRLLSFRRVADQ